TAVLENPTTIAPTTTSTRDSPARSYGTPATLTRPAPTGPGHPPVEPADASTPSQCHGSAGRAGWWRGGGGFRRFGARARRRGADGSRWSAVMVMVTGTSPPLAVADRAPGTTGHPDHRAAGPSRGVTPVPEQLTTASDAATDPGPAYVLESVTKRYGRQRRHSTVPAALTDVTLTIPRGRTTVVAEIGRASCRGRV